MRACTHGLDHRLVEIGERALAVRQAGGGELDRLLHRDHRDVTVHLRGVCCLLSVVRCLLRVVCCPVITEMRCSTGVRGML